ncbi:PREDICTED: serine-rich adhesin for platelets-like [Polistes dominula]|uniref:Serine-rich adhesin for platelets-like n=1 Tax=Polistes dominula TaxID=743375 RepID=A0ABM1JG68_POLDO|nr:PREDICTED: serine-rich adhesin for platelets-like [Polistes dominula]
MRGTPIIITTPKTITRGFYVTKGDIEITTMINPTTQMLMEKTDPVITNNETILSKMINEQDNILMTDDLSEDNSITSRTTFDDSDKQYSEYSSVFTKLEQTTPLIMTTNISQDVTQNDGNLFIVKNDLSTSGRRTIGYSDVTTPLYRSHTNLIADTTTELNTNSETKTIPTDYTVSTESGNTKFDITIPETITPVLNTLNTPEIAIDNNQEENELDNVSSTKLTNDQSKINAVVSDQNIVISDDTSETQITTPNTVATFETITARKEIESTRWDNMETTTMIGQSKNGILDEFDIGTTIQEKLTDVDDKIVSKSDRNFQQRKIFTTSTTTVPSSILLSSQIPQTTLSNQKNNIHRRRQRQRIIVLNNQFGQRRRPNLNRRVIEDEHTTKVESNNPKRIVVYRKRQRKPINDNSFTTVASNSVTVNDVGSKVIDNKTRRSKLVIKRLKINRKQHKEEEEEEEEDEEDEESVPLEKTNTLRDSPLVTDYTERPVDEGTVSKNSGSSSNRTPGSILLANRIRKPNPSSSLSSILSTNKRPTVLLGDNRKGRPSETTLSSPTTTIVGIIVSDLFNDDDATVKPEQFVEDERAEISDQNGRAQELAVTLADPPTLQSSSNTGRVPLRDTLRRRISTTVAPRTNFPRSSSTSLRFSTVPKTRQKTSTTTTTTTTMTTTINRRKEGTTRSSTIRPRRPQIIDYDYYEDEDTPIVEKAMYNGKLFLTNTGTIRCLDQGNFPHPVSCKKFITCAKMVNGLIIGAEYTCPDKLSFDPVGGICNWSAGLGCKE